MPATELLDETARKKPKKKARHDLEDMVMDITPMIDVVFQLLIFFMVATKFKTLEGKLTAYLPKDKGHVDVATPEQPLPIRVTLTWNPSTRQAKVYVGQTFAGVADQGGLSAAKRKVRQLISTGTDKSEIDAAPGLPYRYVVETLNMLIDTRCKEISFAGSPG